MSGVIGINNFLKTATVLTEETMSGYPFSNAIEGNTAAIVGFGLGATRTVDIDLGASKLVSAVGIARHNCFSAGATLQFYLSNTETFTTPFLVIDFDSNAVVFKMAHTATQTKDFSEAYGRYLRIVCTGHTLNALIGNIYVGEALSLPCNTDVNFQPYEYSDNDEIITNLTYTYDVLGIGVIRKPKSSSIKMDAASISWMEANYKNLVSAMKAGPIYWTWKDYGKSAFYCWPTKTIGNPKYTEKGQYFAFEIKVEGITE